MNSLATERLAVCSWSLQPKDLKDLLEKLHATGLSRVQLALDPLRSSSAVWGDAATFLADNGISVTSGMIACVDEDYSTLDSIRLTGGIAPDRTWSENLRNFRIEAEFAACMGLKLVTFHAGFFPERSKPGYAKMLQRLAEVANLFIAHNLTLGLETGQETAADLAALLNDLNLPNIGVNFDPANMILYDKGDPVAALRVLGPWIRQVHIKDARRTKVTGAWGEEVPVGTGDVNWLEFFAVLESVKYSGDFAIEREAGSQRVVDIRTARAFVESALA